MIVDVQANIQQMIDDGKSQKEVLAAKLTAPYDYKVPGGLTPLPAGCESVHRGDNLLISGGTGSGKTTLNVLASFIPETERILEDTAEFYIRKPHVISADPAR